MSWSPFLLLLTLATPARAADLPALDWDLGSVDPESEVAMNYSHDLALQRIRDAQGIKIFWWNIENGETDGRITTGGCAEHAADHPLEHNIIELVHSSAAPDVIGLSEFDPNDPNGLEPWVIEELKRLYPYHVFNTYQPDGRWTEGVGVFSKLPLAPRPREELDWAHGATPEAREKNRASWLQKHPEALDFYRPYLRFESLWRGKRVNLVFEHLVDPWLQIRQDWLDKTPRLPQAVSIPPIPGALNASPLIAFDLAAAAKAEETWASYKTWREIFLRDDSPLSVQAHELFAKLARDFGKELNSAPVVLTGDLNAPRSSTVYRLLAQKLKDTFSIATGNIPYADHSFPSRCADTFGKIPALKIDHSLVSGMQARAAEVLYLHGSDHYPLYVVVEP